MASRAASVIDCLGVVLVPSVPGIRSVGPAVVTRVEAS